jgi:hypothetical protein
VSYSAITPGRKWTDTDGQPIQAHGGSIMHLDGTFYWYGENKENSKSDSGVWHWGVRCYTFTDLYNWRDCGLIIPPDLDDPESPLHPSRMMDRPHILFNRRTRQFVCWLKLMSGGHVQESTILVADSILGPYRTVRSGLRPLGMHAGDFDLVIEPTDGKAYYYFERVHRELICADLTDDYTDVTGYYSTHFPHPHPPLVREAPAHFFRSGLHYLFTSGTTWYFPSRSELACARSYHGPWTVLGDPHPGDSTGTSFRSQVSSVFRHPHKKDLYIALADRWLPDASIDGSAVAAAIAAAYAGEDPASPAPESGRSGSVSEYPDTSVADYVWLPLRFEGEMAYIDWHDEWRIGDYS